jgi:hypothetical protein
MQIETLNHAESTGDAQEKQARSYELAFAENKKVVNSKFGAHLFNRICITNEKNKEIILQQLLMHPSKKFGDFCLNHYDRKMM